MQTEFDLTDTTSELVEKLANWTGASPDQVMTDAVTLLAWAAVAVSTGKAIASVDEKQKVWNHISGVSVLDTIATQR